MSKLLASGTGAGRAVLLGLALVTVLAACAGQPESLPDEEPRAAVETEAAVDRAVATTGDIITYRVAVEHPSVAIPARYQQPSVLGIEVAPDCGAPYASFELRSGSQG